MRFPECGGGCWLFYNTCLLSGYTATKFYINRSLPSYHVPQPGGGRARAHRAQQPHRASQTLRLLQWYRACMPASVYPSRGTAQAQSRCSHSLLSGLQQSLWVSDSACPDTCQSTWSRNENLAVLPFIGFCTRRLCMRLMQCLMYRIWQSQWCWCPRLR